MTRKLEIMALVFICCLGAAASINPGAITGTVRDTAGVPQMGAVIEVLANSAPHIQSAQTDAKGAFSIAGLLPGLYTVKVTAPSFLPTIRESVHLQSGVSLRINVTLNTLFEAIQFVPRHKASADPDDDWRWALRSAANRPILRLADDSPLVVVQSGEDASDGQLKVRVSFITSSDGDLNSTGMDTSFQVEQSVFSKRSYTPTKWSLSGGIGSSPINPNAAIRAAYSRETPNGGSPEIALSARHFASLSPDQPAIQALALSIANSMTFGRFLELDYGGDTQTIQYRARTTSYHPFCTVSAHPGKNTILQYRYATSAPDMRAAKGFDTASADLTDSSPHLTITPGGERIERASHHELSVSQRLAGHKLQLALYSDVIHNAALTGTGAVFTEDTNFLIGDPYSGNFYYDGGSLHAQGIRAVYSHPVAAGLDATFDYGYGGVLTSPANLLQLSQTSAALVTVKRHSAALKLSGTAPHSRTRVIASYRWLSGSALTPVDLFNASAGETEPYLSFFLRQPISVKHVLPKGMEALLDVRNLLAQGYRPVLSADGSTVYLVQGARCVRAGLSFNF
jgi:hypothetical protein